MTDATSSDANTTPIDLQAALPTAVVRVLRDRLSYAGSKQALGGSSAAATACLIEPLSNGTNWNALASLRLLTSDRRGAKTANRMGM
jgi:aerobic-type carbon monoxide dehydrogenase small subunit (CoxS/CutS family)